jgi:hypothetical protein
MLDVFHRDQWASGFLGSGKFITHHHGQKVVVRSILSEKDLECFFHTGKCIEQNEPRDIVPAQVHSARDFVRD